MAVLYNKFDSKKSLGVCYWHVKLTQRGYMEHGLAYITFYVQKHMTLLGVCCGLPLVSDNPHLWGWLIMRQSRMADQWLFSWDFISMCYDYTGSPVTFLDTSGPFY